MPKGISDMKLANLRDWKLELSRISGTRKSNLDKYVEQNNFDSCLTAWDCAWPVDLAKLKECSGIIWDTWDFISLQSYKDNISGAIYARNSGLRQCGVLAKNLRNLWRKGCSTVRPMVLAMPKGLHLHHMGCLETSLVSNPFKIVARGLFMQEIRGFGNAE